MCISLTEPAESGKQRSLSTIGAVHDSAFPHPTEARLHLHDNKTRLEFLIDSGAAVSLLPAMVFRGNRQPASMVLYAANATQISTYGMLTLTPTFNLRRNLSWSFTIADVQKPIIGADFLKHFGLLIDLKN